MNRYLRYLEAEALRPNDPANRAILRQRNEDSSSESGGANLQKCLPGELPKLPKVDRQVFGSFGSAGGECFSKIQADPHERMPVDVHRMLAELRAMIDELATVENWPDELHADIMTRAMRGPPSDLMPNVAHFNQRLQEHRADAAARELSAARMWRGEGFDDRRADPDADHTRRWK